MITIIDFSRWQIQLEPHRIFHLTPTAGCLTHLEHHTTLLFPSLAIQGPSQVGKPLLMSQKKANIWVLPSGMPRVCWEGSSRGACFSTLPSRDAFFSSPNGIFCRIESMIMTQELWSGNQKTLRTRETWNVASWTLGCARQTDWGKRTTTFGTFTGKTDKPRLVLWHSKHELQQNRLRRIRDHLKTIVSSDGCYITRGVTKSYSNRQ